MVAILRIYCKQKDIKQPLWITIVRDKSAGFIGLITVSLFVTSAVSSFHNKCEMVQMFSLKTIGSVEHELTTPDCAVFYTPVYRLIFSLYANHLASQQVDRLVEAKDRASVQSCALIQKYRFNYWRKSWTTSFAAIWIFYEDNTASNCIGKGWKLNTFHRCCCALESYEFRF